MTDATFTPVLYLKAGCPHCLKLRLFLLEAGLLPRFDVREFAPGTPEEEAIRGELAGRLARVTFPAVQVAPGTYVADSDVLVAHYAADAGIDPETLPTYAAYVTGIYPRYAACRRELAALKAQAG